MNRLWLWLAAPIIAGHLGCLAVPAVVVTLGVPLLMPICGEANLRWFAWSVRVLLLGL